MVIVLVVLAVVVAVLLSFLTGPYRLRSPCLVAAAAAAAPPPAGEAAGAAAVIAAAGMVMMMDGLCAVLCNGLVYTTILIWLPLLSSFPQVSKGGRKGGRGPRANGWGGRKELGFWPLLKSFGALA